MSHYLFGDFVNKRILMIYIEPTPYVIDLIREVRKAWDGEIEVLFLSINHSQNWGLDLDVDKYSVWSGEGVYAYWDKIRSGKYSLVHLAGWGHKYLLFGLFFARLLGARVSMESDTPLPQDLSLSKRILKRLLLPVIFKIPNIFLPGGKKQAEFFQHYGVDEEKIIIAQMTVDIQKILSYTSSTSENKRLSIRRHSDITTDSFVFLYVGRLEPHKGVLDLVHVFNKLTDTYSNIDLLIVGDGSLRQIVQDLSVKYENIKYTGRLSGDDLIDKFCIADSLVLPSTFEPWGLVINEAMAAGLPVIVSDCVGCHSDLVEEEITGFIYDVGDVKQLAMQMEKLISDKNNSEKMGTNSLKKISGWTKENEAENVVGAWDKVLSLK